MRTDCLLINRFERAPSLGMHFVTEQRLCTRSDIGERIIDLVARAVGELFHRVEFLPFKIVHAAVANRSGLRDPSVFPAQAGT